MDNATRELLPCPFCGGNKISLSEGTTFRWRYVGCGECGAQMEFRSDNRFEPTDETWKDAAETWNRRHSTPAPAAPADHAGLLAEIDALYEKATKGPWALRTMGQDCFLQGNEVAGKTVAGDYGREILSDEYYEKKPYDAALIGALVNAWPRIRAALPSPQVRGREEGGGG